MVQTFLKWLAELSPKILIETPKPKPSPLALEKYRIHHLPATALLSDTDPGIRYYGALQPTFADLIVDDVILVGSRDSGLPGEFKKEISRIENQARIQIFLPRSFSNDFDLLHVPHRLALENPNVLTEIIDGSTFPDLLRQHLVYHEPKVFVNGWSLVGFPQSEEAFLEEVLRLAGQPEQPYY